MTTRPTGRSWLAISATSPSGDNLCSLTDYVSRMKENQKNIYYITGESKESLDASCSVERIKNLSMECFYIIGSEKQRKREEALLEKLQSYQSKNLKNFMKSKQEKRFIEAEEAEEEERRDSKKHQEEAEFKYWEEKERSNREIMEEDDLQCIDSSLYDRLGVRPTDSQAEIKKKWFQLNKDLHPDRNPNQNPEELQLINSAYNILKDPDQRKYYDIFGNNDLNKEFESWIHPRGPFSASGTDPRLIKLIA